ncbi:MAG: glycosyltransferase family 2 protein [Henriciella sp.]|uniref:glycosyltransferase family 2 protein n=1 Tax=Henriciella sp. TaxID=1968823 RepID=UPI0032EC55B3
MSPRPVTAIIVTYLTGPRLRESLYALLACRDVTTLLIINNGNPPAMTDWLKTFAAEHAKVQLISPGDNLGFGKAINLASRQAEEGFLLLVNPDAVIKHDAVSTLVAASEHRQRPWLLGGRIFDLHGKEGRGDRRRKLTLWRALTSSAGIDTWNLNTAPLPSGPTPVGAVSGALMLTDTESFRQLGGFDEAYFIHVEDVDLCRRAKEAGGEVIFCPDAGALHYGSTSDVSSKTVARHKAESLTYYFRKFSGNPVSRALVSGVIGPLLKWMLPARARD